MIARPVCCFALLLLRKAEKKQQSALGWKCQTKPKHETVSKIHFASVFNPGRYFYSKLKVLYSVTRDLFRNSVLFHCRKQSLNLALTVFFSSPLSLDKVPAWGVVLFNRAGGLSGQRPQCCVIVIGQVIAGFISPVFDFIPKILK